MNGPRSPARPERGAGTGPILCAVGATWASTNAAASRDSSRVRSAIRRACQARRSPRTTRRHTRGRRCRSSRACPTYALPASVDRPMAAANSVTANSATNGAPSPASGIPWSPYPTSISASSIESVECIAAQSTACCSRPASAASAIARSSRASSEHRRSGVELDRVCCHRRIQAPTTDTQTPKTPCSTGMWTTSSRNLETATTAVDPSRPREGKQAEVVRRPQRRATT